MFSSLLSALTWRRGTRDSSGPVALASARELEEVDKLAAHSRADST